MLRTHLVPTYELIHAFEQMYDSKGTSIKHKHIMQEPLKLNAEVEDSF